MVCGLKHTTFSRYSIAVSRALLFAFIYLLPLSVFSQELSPEFGSTHRARSLEEFNPVAYQRELMDRGVPEPTAVGLVKQELELLRQGRSVTTHFLSRTQPATANSVCGTCHDMGAENGWGVWQAQEGENVETLGLMLNPTTPSLPRFSITSGPGIDPFTPGLTAGSPPITVVAPPGFGSHSILLGEPRNDGQGGGCDSVWWNSPLGLAAGCAERLTYCFTVGIADTNFIYAYAFVMENPGNTHTNEQMPNVEFMMLGPNNDTLSCAYQRYVANESFPGQYVCNQTRRNRDTAYYKPWTIEGINLSAYIGQTLTVVITNADCQLGGHFCHSYWDFQCGSANPIITPSCYTGVADTFVAPAPADSGVTYSYLWYKNNNPTPIGNTQIISPITQPGDTFVVRVSTGGGCYFFARFVPQHFTVSTNFNFTTGCGFANFTSNSVSTSTDNPINYWSWDFGAGAVPRTSSSANPSNVNLPPGNHVVTLISGTYGPGCRDTVQYTVNVPQRPIANFTRSGNCTGAPITFTNSSSITPPDSIVSYSWSFPGGTPSTSTAINPVVTYAQPVSGGADATLIVTASNGCVDTVTNNFTVRGAPIAAFTANSICLGDTLQLVNSSTNPFSTNTLNYTWSIPGGTPSFSTSRNPNVVFTNPGPVTITLIASSGSSCPDTVTATISVAATPVAAFSAPSVCAGGVTQFLNSSSISPGDTITSFAWSFPGGTPSTSTASSPGVNYLSPGTYPVSLYITNSGGCSDSVQQNVTVLSNPIASFTVADVCIGFPVQVNNTSTIIPAGSAVNYSWNMAGGTPSTSSAVSPIVNYSTPGTSTITLIATSPGGCSDTVQATVNVRPLPVAAFTAPAVCFGTPTVFANTSSASSGSIASYHWSFQNGTPATSTATNPSVVFGASGMLNSTLIVTDNYGCADTIVQPVIVNANPVASFTAPSICLDAPFQLTNNSTVSPAGSVMTYDWSIPGGTPSASTAQQPQVSFAAPGSSAITLITTSPGGCSDTAQLTVNIYPLPVAGFSAPSVCFGRTTPFTNTSVAPAGGTISTYNWSIPGATPNTSTVLNPAVNYSAPGQHTASLVVTTNHGCTDTLQQLIDVLANPVASFTATPICFGEQMLLDNLSTITPVNDPISYAWSIPGGSPSTSSLDEPLVNFPAPGSYPITLIATSLSGCSDTLSMNVDVHPLPSAAFSAPYFCAGSGGTLSNLSTISQGSTIAAYSWNIPGGNPSSFSGPSPSVIFNTADTSIVTLVVTSSNGCVDTVINPVVIRPLPVVVAPDVTICPGATGTVTASGAASYLWSNGATTSSINVTPAATTVYTVTGTTAGCSSSTTAIAAITNSMTVNAGIGDTVCLGGSVTLNATPDVNGYNYYWSPATGLSSTTIANPVSTPTSDITYSVTVTDLNGCSGTGIVNVVVDFYPSVIAQSTPVACFGGSDGTVTATSSGGFGPYVYLWSTGCTNFTCAGLPVGNYQVTISDAIGCTATNSVLIGTPSQLTVTGTPTANVPCNSYCTATGTVTPAGGTPPYQYAWNSVPIQSAMTASGLCAGNYTCVVTDANGCTTSHSMPVSEPTPVVAAPVVTNVPCIGGSTYLSASGSGGSGSYTYSWSPASGLSATNIANPVAAPSDTTVYTVLITDANGCNSNLVNVSVNPSVALSVVASGTGPVCPGDSAFVHAVAANGTGGPYNYSWLPNQGMTVVDSVTMLVRPTTTTVYTVTVTDGCSASLQSFVTVQVHTPPNPVILNSPAEGCAPLCVSFNSGMIPGTGAVTWNFGPGQGVSNEYRPTHCYESPGEYYVNVHAVSNQGCSADAAETRKVTVHENPYADFTVSSDAASHNLPVFWFDDRSSSNVVQWQWDFGDGSPNVFGSPSVQHSYAAAAPGNDFYSFTTTLYVSTAFGCRDVITRPLRMEPEFEFHIPNAFTPNGDDANATFYGKGLGIRDYEIWIFDRWGLEIYHCDYKGNNVPWDFYGEEGMPSACKWDGIVAGRPVQSDVYVWKVRLTDVFGKKHNYIGRVTVLY